MVRFFLPNFMYTTLHYDSLIKMQMVPLVQKSVESLVNVFHEKAESGRSFEFFRYIT